MVTNLIFVEESNCLHKREIFCVKLRKEKKERILAEKRRKLGIDKTTEYSLEHNEKNPQNPNYLSFSLFNQQPNLYREVLDELLPMNLFFRTGSVSFLL